MPHAVLNPAGLHDPVPFGYSHTASPTYSWWPEFIG